MASESLHYTLAFDLSVPDFDGAVGRAGDDENLIEYALGQ